MELLFPLLLLVPLGLLILRQRKQQKAFVQQQDRVQVGMTVMTTAGLYGLVVDVEDDVMVLEIAEGVQVRWSKLAVGRIVDTGVATDEVDELDAEEFEEQFEPEGVPADETVDIRKRDDARADGA